MEPIDVLKKARSLLSNPDHWTKGVFARNKNGEKVFSTSEEATCWCAEGAIMKCSVGARHASLSDEAERLLRNAIPTEVLRKAEIVGHAPIPHYNDADLRTHEEILALFDEAIVMGEIDAGRSR